MASAAQTRELILGRYRAIRPLGSGGMGHVWLTRDEETGLDVALKMVIREGKAAHRAEREARAAAALRHPRCQRIFALAHDSDHVYIAYEYIPGCTLRQTLGSPGITDAEAVEVAAQVLEALAHAHGRGIVHRDVKPSNVLLAESDVIDARLLDFGLAQMAEFDTLTAVGDIPGTLAYVSPERLTGENATAAADVWAVGVILWESLTGEHPFRGENVEGTSRQIRAGAPPIETYRPDLPQSLRVALTRALDVDPANRPSAAELAGWLRSQHEREEKRQPRTRVPSTGAAPLPAALVVAARGRLLPAATAAVWTGWVTASLPFYPAGWPAFLTILTAGIGLARPRLGLPVALAITFFPLANISLGLALLFAVVGAAWVCLGWRDPRGAFVLVAAPLLGPIFSLALVPLLAQLANGTVRRIAQAGAAVFITAVVAAYEGARLPFESTPPPLGAGIVGSDRPTAVAGALLKSAEQHPLLLREAAIIMIGAAALPYLRGKGPWIAAAGGGTLIAATALAAPAAAFLPIVAAGWLTAGMLALPRR